MNNRHFENSSHISPDTAGVQKKWMNLLRQSRRTYFFQKWTDQKKKRKIPFNDIIEWMFDDIQHIVLWNINILFQLRAYGSLIKKVSGLSFLKQWYRMVYLVLFIRTTAQSFRLLHLFNQNSWNRVKEFTFNRHIKVHNDILGYPHHVELEMLNHKLKFFEHCQSKVLKTPEILAVFENGKVSLPSSGMFKVPERDLFVKEMKGDMGRGAKKLRFKNGSFYDREGKIFSKNELHEFLIDYSKNTNSIIVQYALKNHNSWKKYTSGGLATCRIVTGISPWDEGEIIPFFASMKMPVGNSDVDNFSKGSLVAPVDIRSGIMGSAISFKPYQSKFVFDVHPGTGHPVKGEILPMWNELIEFTKNVHLHFKTICIGWDVGFTESGFCILEGNVQWGSDIIEAPANRPLADTIYPEWFGGWAKRMKGKEVIPFRLLRH